MRHPEIPTHDFLRVATALMPDYTGKDISAEYDKAA